MVEAKLLPISSEISGSAKDILKPKVVPEMF